MGCKRKENWCLKYYLYIERIEHFICCWGEVGPDVQTEVGSILDNPRSLEAFAVVELHNYFTIEGGSFLRCSDRICLLWFVARKR